MSRSTVNGSASAKKGLTGGSASQSSNLAAVTPGKGDRPINESTSAKKIGATLPVSASTGSAKKGFSFLNTLSTTVTNKALPNSSSKQNISLSTALSTNSLTSSAGKKVASNSVAPPVKGTLPSGLDFIPLASLTPAIGGKRAHDLASHAQKMKSHIPSGGETNNNKIDLLELERQNKKNKKRKSLDSSASL